MSVALSDTTLPVPAADALPVEHALYFASRGVRVFPLGDNRRPGTLAAGAPDFSKMPRGKCAACKASGKTGRSCFAECGHALCHGSLGATTDPNVIREMWRRHPRANIGGATGRESGVLVIEADVAHRFPDGRVVDGRETLTAAIAENAGEWPTTQTHLSGSDGPHYLFAYPDRPRADGSEWGNTVGGTAAAKVCEGVDGRGRGGYVVLPGSSSNKGLYRVQTTADFAPVPEWVLARIDKAPAPKRPNPTRVNGTATRTPATGDRVRDAARRMFDRAIDNLRNTTSGRNDALNRAAYAVAGLVWHEDSGITEQEARDALWSAVTANGYIVQDGEAAAAASLESGWRSGWAKPATPWPPGDRSFTPRGGGMTEEDVLKVVEVFGHPLDEMSLDILRKEISDDLWGRHIAPLYVAANVEQPAAPVPAPRVERGTTTLNELKAADGRAVNGTVPPAPVGPKSAGTAPGDVRIDFSRSARWDYSHEGNATRFVAVHGTDTVAYVPKLNLVRTWRGSVWATDSGTHLTAMVGDVARLMRKQADADLAAAFDAVAADKDDEQAKAALKRAQEFDKWVTKSRMGNDIEHTAKAVRRLPGVEVPAGLWDADPRLLNCANGTLELKHDGTVRFREHRAADRITQQTATSYDPSATCPDWEAFLAWALPDEQVRHRFQLTASLSLIGVNSRHVFAFAIGGTRSGKSTAIEVLARVLDNKADPDVAYSGSFKMASLRPKRESGGSPDLVRLLDRRFVFGSEPNDGWSIAADVIKALAGGDRQNIRDNYGKASGMIDREPKFTPWIIANASPEITGADDALFERVRAFPFDRYREEHERDDTLKDRLPAQEGSGILNWLLRGFADLAADPTLINRANMPAACTALAARMREEADVYSRFLSECTEPCPCDKAGCVDCVPAGESWETFKRWARDSNEKADTNGRFNTAMSAAGYKAEQKKIGGRNVRRRLGLKLNDEAFMDDAADRAHGDTERLALIAKARGDDDFAEMLGGVDI